MLHPEFLQRLRALPQSYDYGEYRLIYRDYGTHYVTEAALGGNYEHTIIIDKEKLEKTGGSSKLSNLYGTTYDSIFKKNNCFLFGQITHWTTTKTAFRLASEQEQTLKVSMSREVWKEEAVTAC